MSSANDTIVDCLPYKMSTLYHPVLRSELSEGAVDSTMFRPFMAFLHNEASNSVVFVKDNWELRFYWNIGVRQPSLTSEYSSSVNS